jgi:hypothetical protein
MGKGINRRKTVSHKKDFLQEYSLVLHTKFTEETLLILHVDDLVPTTASLSFHDIEYSS